MKVLGKIALAILAGFLALSLILNFYLMEELKRTNNVLEIYRNLMKEMEVSRKQIGVSIINWKIYPQPRPGVYLASVTFEVINYGHASAVAIIAVSIKHADKILYESFKIGVNVERNIPVIERTYIVVPPGEKHIITLDFDFLNPENLDVYPFIYVEDAYPATRI